jgi:hypothetical protein
MDVSGSWIIAVAQGDGFAPALKPRSFSSEKQAKAVAAIMARKHPGERFIIFKAVGHAEVVPSADVVMYAN